MKICASRAGDQATAFAAYREAVLRGAEDDTYWHFDLEGSATARGITLELIGIDLYGQKVKLYTTMNNANSSVVWHREIVVEWPGGSETVSVGAENLDLAAGESEWTTTLPDVTISPGDWLRVTAKYVIFVGDDQWVAITVATTIPELNQIEQGVAGELDLGVFHLS